MAALLLIGANARAGVYTTATDETDPIPSGVGLASTIASSGFIGNIGSLTVTLDISGGNNGDLYAYLSYDGVLVTILNRPGVSGGNPFGDPGSGFNVSLIDAASVNLNSFAGTAGLSTTGTFNVNGTSGNNGSAAFGSAYNGLNPNGTWTLYVENEVSGGESSSLVSWTLAINAVPEPTNVALGVFGVCAVAGRLRAGWKKSRPAAKSNQERK
jgi:subtilisin-like proprotein convertase family protein